MGGLLVIRLRPALSGFLGDRQNAAQQADFAVEGLDTVPDRFRVGQLVQEGRRNRVRHGITSTTDPGESRQYPR
jgi:hypothetical protein